MPRRNRAHVHRRSQRRNKTSSLFWVLLVFIICLILVDQISEKPKEKTGKQFVKEVTNVTGGSQEKLPTSKNPEYRATCQNEDGGKSNKFDFLAFLREDYYCPSNNYNVVCFLH